MQLSNLSSTSFKGMLMLQDEIGSKCSINPQAISTVTDLSENSFSMKDSKATRIDMIGGGVKFTPLRYEQVMSAIETANNTCRNVDLFA